MVVALPFGLAIGLVIGTVGGGGSILALPVLIYVLHERVGVATTESLVVVGLAAAIAVCSSAREREVCWRIAFLFAGPAAAGALLGALGNRLVGGRALVLAFLPLMVVAAYVTWRRTSAPAGSERAACPPSATGRTAIAGFGVGALTGFFGVGGGFVIVPVLTGWLGTSLRRAMATSLAVIAFTALSALASHLLLSGGRLDVGVTAALAAATAVGAVAGSSLRARLPRRALGHGFALVVVAVACLLAVDVLLLHGPPGAG